MKIAIATDGNIVSAHFGHCPQYTIYDVDEKQRKVNSKLIIENPGHQPGFLPGYLAKLGVNCIIAGGMGPRAKELFAHNNIATITGVSGRVDDVIQEYLKGNIADSGNLCDHGDGHGGHCSH
ncbi:NifB/NifX family molybdenum-iron cluster-binding protein [Thermovorax subterraneus]|nr:NifB/NifX family molybdenum-iron cluster-binding protein [Thermovorax subterraneus]